MLNELNDININAQFCNRKFQVTLNNKMKITTKIKKITLKLYFCNN